MSRKLVRRLVSFIVLGAVVALPSQAEDLSAQLRQLVFDNPELGQALQNGLDHQLNGCCPRCNDGKKSYWVGKTLDDFYNFFAEWQTHTPGDGETPAEIGQHDLQFADYVTAPEGYLAVQTPLFRSWMIDFINARKKYLESPESAKYVGQLPSDWLKDYVVPAGGFQSWIAFFTRQLKPGVRPYKDKENSCILNSPVDAGFAPASSILAEDIDYPTLRAKGDVLSVREVFNNHPSASRFQGGSVLTFWLEFSNAHWFFAPVDGKVVASEVLAGLYSKEYAFQNLPAHKRGYLLVETKEFGLVGLLVVGLQTVSEINLTVAAGDTIRKGDALGYFNYGGSTAMIFYEKGTADLTQSFRKVLKDAEKQVPPGINAAIEVRIGQDLLRATSAACR